MRDTKAGHVAHPPAIPGHVQYLQRNSNSEPVQLALYFVTI